MKTSILIILLSACLVGCEYFNKAHEDKYSTDYGDFIINYDKVNILLNPYIDPNLYNLTHAIKYKEKYYCIFTNKKDMYNKSFFSFSIDGTAVKEIELPNRIKQCYYLDLFVMHDTIFSKPYMSDKFYYLNLQSTKWIETTEPDDLIYEDEKFYVTSYDFGEWGNTTWFKDKYTGKEYEIGSGSSIINRIDTNYFITMANKILMVKNPLNLKECEMNYYYQKVKKTKYANGSTSFSGSEIIYNDTLFNPWKSNMPNPLIYSSFRVNGNLYHFCNDSLSSFISILKESKLIPIVRLNRKFSIINWNYSYRCRLQNNQFQMLKFDTKWSNIFGFIEISNNKLTIRYLVLN